MASTTLTGTTGNDSLNGIGSVSALVQGLAGNDTVTLNHINDEGDGGEGNDSLVYQTSGSANNTIQGGAGNDTIFIQSAASFTGSLDGGTGTDSIALTSSATTSSANIFLGLGADTIAYLGTVSASTIGAGSGADLVTFTNASTVTSTRINGGEQKDTIRFYGAGTHTSSTVQAGKGADLLVFSGGQTTTNALIGTGKGHDSINIESGTYTTSTIAGGYGNDTITMDGTGLGALGRLYGGSDGSTASGTDDATYGDADLFIGSTNDLVTASSIYGGGGNDTITLFDLGNASAYVDGGDGTDSITIISGSGVGSINGGAGNDTIVYGDYNNAALNNTARLTINGGAGTDVIRMASDVGTQDDVIQTASTANMIVAYGAGDIIRLTTTITPTQANWTIGNVVVMSDTTFTTLDATVGGSFSQIGSVGVFSDGTDTWFAVNTAAALNGASYSVVLQVTGKDLVTTTLLGVQVALNSTNFGFEVGYMTSTTGLDITLT